MTKQFLTKINFTFCLIVFSMIMIWQKTRIVRNVLGFSQCRFFPSCSDYFVDSIKQHGLLKGVLLGVKRILSCNPMHEEGIKGI